MNQQSLELIKLQVEILKLKADDHDWQCYVPEDVKKDLEDTLSMIKRELEIIKALDEVLDKIKF